MIDMGAGKLSRIYGVQRDLIVEARKKARELVKLEKRKHLPKILIFDIETAPLEAYVYQKEVWKARVADDKIISQWFMLSWSAKWLFDDVVMSKAVSGKEALDEDDRRIVGGLWSLFDQADIIIAHNGGAFDIPNMNTRFVVNGFPPPSAYQMIDTLKVARREFGFTHNSLNALAKVFGVDEKIETNFDLWKKCKRGDAKALKEMERYNRRDVTILEEVYLRIRPWIKSHPNVGLFVNSDEPVCPYCGSEEVIEDDNHYYTMTGKYATYVCKRCGGISRARKTSFDKEKAKNLIVSIAR
jgi:DNA polymerase III alpha subunit (gram-positive type)/DNA-directed RNA polymerase subunit RPC12/RpoP